MNYITKLLDFLYIVWTAIKIFVAFYLVILAIMFIVLSASWIMIKLFPLIFYGG